MNQEWLNRIDREWLNKVEQEFEEYSNDKLFVDLQELAFNLGIGNFYMAHEEIFLEFLKPHVFYVVGWKKSHPQVGFKGFKLLNQFALEYHQVTNKLLEKYSNNKG